MMKGLDGLGILFTSLRADFFFCFFRGARYSDDDGEGERQANVTEGGDGDGDGDGGGTSSRSWRLIRSCA